jgi:SAM-dependent methyltransferase
VTQAPDDALADRFDEPSKWTADIITEFRLRGAERCAAASPSPGFPQLLESVLRTLAESPDAVWLDVGGGLGGTASWIERTVGRQVIVAEPSLGSLRAAQRLFPSLPLTAATGAHLPIRDDSVGAALAVGVVSLLDDIDAVLAEIVRLLVDGGRLAIADLWSSSPRSFSEGPNHFWSMEDAIVVASRHGLRVRHLAFADLDTGWWSTAGLQVRREIEARFATAPAYEVWRQDIDHLDRVIASGRVTPAAMILG